MIATTIELPTRRVKQNALGQFQVQERRSDRWRPVGKAYPYITSALAHLGRLTHADYQTQYEPKED